VIPTVRIAASTQTAISALTAIPSATFNQTHTVTSAPTATATRALTPTPTDIFLSTITFFFSLSLGAIRSD